MRKYGYPLLITLSLAACSKHDEKPIAPAPIIVRDTSAALFFRTVPTATDQLQLSFPWIGNLAKVYLENDTGIVGTYPLVPVTNFSYNATINYPFAAGRRYSFLVESAPANGVAYRYFIRNYTHIYTAQFTYQKLLTLTQSLGPQAFDISPSRNTLFITDDITNTLSTKRLSLKDGRIDTIGGIFGLVVRAINDSEILVKGATPQWPANIPYPTPTGDSAILVRYNVNTKQSSFVSYVSSNYARYSRIVDNHILTTLPLFPGNSVLINLGDTTKRVYPAAAFNFSLVAENNFDHIFYGNQIVNPVTGALQSILPTDSVGIQSIDSATGYITSFWYTTPAPTAISFKSRIAVWLPGNPTPVYQSDLVNNRSFVSPRHTSIANNRLLFYQGFGYDTAYHIDGYYQLDLNTQTTTLVHCFSTPYVLDDFQLDPHTLISVRPDGVYRVATP